MITMNGKYNSANIMIDEIDASTLEQIQTFLNHPAFANSYIAIMPDCHAGIGAVIGFTMKVNDYIIPNVVGVDIGCGMLSGCFGEMDVDLHKLDEYIKQNIPSGRSIHNNAKLEDDSVLNLWTDLIGMDYSKALRSIGTLGGGNHFLELGRDSKNKLWFTIHSGSRNFGLRLANYFQQKAKDNLAKYFIVDQYKGLEFLLTDSHDGKDYLDGLEFAQRYASINRDTMLNIITRFFGIEPIEIIESKHNFIEGGIIRKGATPADSGQRVLIPFNMRDGIARCVGKGCKKYNYSAPHGAGRILSRPKAKEILSVDDFQSTMRANNIFTTTATNDTLDESPMAYKDKQVILDNIGETVDVIDFIKPIYNFKASE